MQDLSRFVPNVHFEQIPIKNLVSNQEYQRPLSQAQVEKAIEDFDLNQINPVKVSRRDGINYVFNGQHTIEIIATVSGSRETPVWCMIYDSLDYQNEADIFANQMKHVRPLKPYEIFMANNVVIRGQCNFRDLALGCEGFTGTGDAEDKAVTIQKLLAVGKDEILGDGILPIVDAVSVANLLRLERHEHSEGFCRECPQCINAPQTERQRGN